MRQIDGLRLDLVSENKLSSDGILVGGTQVTPNHNLSDESIQLFLAVASAGTGGLPKTRIPKGLRDLKAALIPLEIHNLVAWERDKHGHEAFLVLTWRGQEALDSARVPRSSSSMAAQRRAAVHKVR